MTSNSFYNAIACGDREEAYAQYVYGGFVRISIISIIMAIISVVALVRDCVVGFYFIPEEPFNVINIFAFCLYFVMAGTVICMKLNARDKQVSVKKCKVAHVMFVIVVDITILALLFSEFMADSFLCFQLYFFLFYAAVPMLKLRDNYINMGLMYVAVSVEYVMIRKYIPTTEDVSTNLLYFTFMVVGALIFALYLRQFYLITIINKYENLRLTKKLQRESEVDQLTGCFNRYALTEAFNEYKSNKADVTVMMIDFDDFKSYNDAFSHIKGDECLQRICNEIKNISGVYKFELYRYGGEEFLLVGNNEDNKYKSLAEDVIGAVARLKLAMPAQSESEYVSVSIGISNVKLDEKSELNSVVGLADEQVYIAKANGKACAYYKGKRVI